jgi:hypothetical protein
MANTPGLKCKPSDANVTDPHVTFVSLLSTTTIKCQTSTRCSTIPTFRSCHCHVALRTAGHFLTELVVDFMSWREPSGKLSNRLKNNPQRRILISHTCDLCLTFLNMPHLRHTPRKQTAGAVSHFNRQAARPETTRALLADELRGHVSLDDSAFLSTILKTDKVSAHTVKRALEELDASQSGSFQQLSTIIEVAEIYNAPCHEPMETEMYGPLVCQYKLTVNYKG